MFKKSLFILGILLSTICYGADDDMSSNATITDMDYIYALTFSEEYKLHNMSSNNSTLALSMMTFYGLSGTIKVKDTYHGNYNLGVRGSYTLPININYISPYVTYEEAKDFRSSDTVIHNPTHGWHNTYGAGIVGPISDRFNGHIEIDDVFKNIDHKHIELGINYELGGNMLVGGYIQVFTKATRNVTGLQLSYLF